MSDKIRKIVKKVVEKVMNEDDLLIDEGLTKTVPLDVAVSRLKFWSQKQKFIYDGEEYPRKLDVKIDKTTDTIVVNDILWFDNKILENFFIILNNLGYFISEFGYSTEIDRKVGYKKYSIEDFEKIFKEKDKLVSLSIVIEAKFDKEINKIPDKLFHLCPQVNLSKILKIGLTPRSGSKISNHPDRIYLAFSREGAKGIGSEIQKYDQENEYVFCLLEIDVEKLKQLREKNLNKSNLRFFDDPNFKNKGVFSLENIPPDAITVLEQKIEFFK